MPHWARTPMWAPTVVTITVLIALLVPVLECAIIYPYDGRGNNADKPEYGTTPRGLSHTAVKPQYADQVSSPTGSGRPNARLVSQTLNENVVPRVNPGVTSFHPTWGQLLVHDFARLQQSLSPSDSFDISVPRCDPHLDDECSGTSKITMNRNLYDTLTGTSSANPRRQLSYVTPWLDASAIYGNTQAISDTLRTFEGGLLKMIDHPTAGTIPPLSSDPAVTILRPGVPTGILTGDNRSAAQPGVTVLHILFAREHNRKAALLQSENAGLSDEELFQKARAWVIGLIQHITKTQYIPALIGGKLAAYEYDANLDPALDAFFAVVSFRYGHTATPSMVGRIGENGLEDPAGSVLLRDAFMNPMYVLESGPDSFIRGMMQVSEHKVDERFASDMRNSAPGTSIDLFAINIQRGREMGMPSYNQARAAFGLTAKTSFADLTSDTTLQNHLTSLYGNIDNLDAYVGGIIETAVPGGLVGELFAVSIREQFTRLMNSDRFWYESDVESVTAFAEETLGKLIERTTPVKAQDNPFNNIARITDTNNDALKVQLTPTYSVSWKIEGDNILITLDSESTGWIGLGFGKRMIEVDLYVGWVSDDGRVTMLDAWTDNFAPRPDEEWGTSSNIISAAGSEAAGRTVITFSRPLGKSDERDRAIGPGLQDCTFAFGSSDVLAYHGAASRGSVRIDFFTGESQAVFSDNIRTIHGLSLGMGWGILAPTGVWIARYTKTWDYWLDAHKLFQAVALSSIVPLGLAAVFTIGRGGTWHQVVGLSILSFTLTQAILGNVVAGVLHTRFRKKARPLKQIHQALGLILLCVAQYQIYLGLGMYGASRGWYIFYAVWESILVVVFLVAELYKQLPRFQSLVVGLGGSRAAGQEGADLPTYDVEDFKKRVAQGKRWIIVDGYIIDIEDWSNVHPGGRLLLNTVVGLDASEAFHGEITALSRHRHGPSALRKLRRLRVGRLEMVKPDLEGGLAGLRRRKFEGATLPSWSESRLEEEAASGRELLVLHGYIADMGSWIDKHPGGRGMFTDKWGKNVDSEFSGIGYGATHAHSNLALEKFQQLIVAQVESETGQQRDTLNRTSFGRDYDSMLFASRTDTMDDLNAQVKWRDAKVVERRELLSTPGRRTVLLRLKVPAASPLVQFRPGQYLHVKYEPTACSAVPVDGETSIPPLFSKATNSIVEQSPDNKKSVPSEDGEAITRPYSIAGCDDDDITILHLVVREFTQGMVSPWLTSSLIAPGCSISVNGPHGVPICPSKGTTDVGFLAAGTGIAPVLAYLRRLERNVREGNITSVPRVHLLYSAHSELLLYDELKAFGNGFQYRPVFTVTHPEGDLPEGVLAGRIDEEKLETYFITRSPSVKVWVCGPPAMEDATLHLLLGPCQFARKQVFNLA